MNSDPLAPFRAMLKGSVNVAPTGRPTEGGNRLEGLRFEGHGLGNRFLGHGSISGGGGGGQWGGGLVGGGDMGPWETSVENRLDSLDRRLMTIDGNITQIATDTAILKTEVSHLPTKGFIVSIVTIAFSLIATLLLFLEKIWQMFNAN